MYNYVVTGFNEKHWLQWGKSWLLSLKEVAKHNEIIVVGYDLAQSTVEKIEDCAKVILIPAGIEYPNNFRRETIRQISLWASNNPGIYAYWDADVYFQEGIEEVFSLVGDKIAITSQPGFLAASDVEWKRISDIQKMLDLINQNNLHSCLMNHFRNLITCLDDTWNFTDIPSLRDFEGKLTFKGNIKKVIHPTEAIKPMLVNQNILFSERYKDLFSEKKKGIHKFIKVSCSANNM